MSQSTRWIAAACTAALVAGGAKRLDADARAGATKSTDGGAEPCPAYWVIGVPGSGEKPPGKHEPDSKREIKRMGDTVAAYVQQAAGLISPNAVQYLALPYPAAAVGDRHYAQSIDTGAKMLEEDIRTRARECPDIRIGVVGYSQGAIVLHQGLSALARSDPRSLEKVRAVLLIADPRANATARYHIAIEPSGDPARRQRGGLLGADTLPRAIQDRATSLCISGDLVCDAARQPRLSLLAVLAPAVFLAPVVIEVMHLRIHTDGYKHCCSHVPYVQQLGATIANRLLPPPSNQPDRPLRGVRPF